MKPAEKIDSIRIHQVTGFGGSTNLGGAGRQRWRRGDPSKPPMTQVMDSILGMALQLPALKSIGESIGVDLSSAVDADAQSCDRRLAAGGADRHEGTANAYFAVSRPVVANRSPTGAQPGEEHVVFTSPFHRLGDSSVGCRQLRCRWVDAFAQGGPIKLGSVLDNSGNLDAYGKPMVQATQLAAEEINAAGGLLGRKIEVVQYDTQSDIALYTKYAQQLARDDKVDIVHGGITSASREAIRQTFRRANVLYFYNVLYEGGVCDRNCFVTGTTPAQAVEPIVEIAIKQWGKKIYVLAADYNYGQITAKWVAHYVKQRGGTIAQTSFFPLDVSDFGSTIAKIQQAKPDVGVSRRWSAARTCRSSGNGRRRA